MAARAARHGICHGVTSSPFLASGTATAPFWTASDSNWRVVNLPGTALEHVRMSVSQATEVFAVRSCTLMSCSAWSEPVMLSNELPLPPQSLSARYEDGGMTVRWRAAAVGPRPDRFDVRVAAVGSTRAGVISSRSVFGPSSLPAFATSAQLAVPLLDFATVEMRACGMALCSDWARATAWGRVGLRERPDLARDPLPIDAILGPLDRIRPIQ